MRSLILAAKRHWKRILKFLGVAGLIDLLKEFVRAKIMDWAYQRLGGFGQWMLDYPIAVLTLGIVAVLLALVVVAVKESRAKEFSHVLDITERPYEMARLSRTWSACFSIAVFAFAMATAYSTYKYYWIKSAPEITVLGYQIVLFKPNFNPFANVFFQNIGGSGKLAIYSSSGLSPTTANPAAIRRELEENNRKVVAEDGGLAFSTAPMEKG